SRTLKLPPSRVSELEFVSQSARRGLAEPSEGFQSETFSVLTCAWTMGTSEDSFLWIVTRSLSLYSKRSPRSRPSAAESMLLRASETAPGASAARLIAFRPFTATPPPVPDAYPAPEPEPRPAPMPRPLPSLLPEPARGDPDTIAESVLTLTASAATSTVCVTEPTLRVTS